MSFGNQHTTAINLSFVLETRRFAFNYFANMYSSRTRKGFEKEQPKRMYFCDLFLTGSLKRVPISQDLLLYLGLDQRNRLLILPQKQNVHDTNFHFLG